MVNRRLVFLISVAFVAMPAFAQTQTETKTEQQNAPQERKDEGVHPNFAGSYIAAEGVMRQHNEVTSGATSLPFGSPIWANSPQYGEHELRMTAQQSRLAFGMGGKIAEDQQLKAYFETDFLGSGVTANSRESNSYNLRVRHAWLAYDNGFFHFMAGQGWSLATMNKKGIEPGNGVAPMTIDAQFVAGFNWARQAQLRFVGDINKMSWLGVSVESPQTAMGGTPNFVSPTPGGGGTAIVAGRPGVLPTGYVYSVNTANLCNSSGLVNGTTYCSNNSHPDVVEKVAFDPGSFAHIEVYGLQRWFTDQVTPAVAYAVPNPLTPVSFSNVANVPGYSAANSVPPLYGVPVGTWKTQNTFGGGVGGSITVHAGSVLDVLASGLAGKGIGRYASSQLPDVIVGQDNGKLAPLSSRQMLVGVIVHPMPGFDIYAYAGRETVDAKYDFGQIYPTTTTPSYPGLTSSYGTGTSGIAGSYGYGNPVNPNDGCQTASVVGGGAQANQAASGTTCTGQIKRVDELTVGFWKDIYKGSAGRFAFGLQAAYVKATAFGTDCLLSQAEASIGIGTAAGCNPAGSNYLLPWVPSANSAYGVGGKGTPNAGLSPDNKSLFFSVRYYPN